MRKTNPAHFLAEYLLSNQESYYRLAFSYVRRKDDALDIVHDSIYKAMASRQSPCQPEEINPWFYRIVVNTALDYLRKNKRIDLVDQEILELSVPAEDTYEDPDLRTALDNLPLSYRSIVVLRYFEDLKLEEIAVILNENMSTVKARLYSALKKLRLQLEDDC